MPAPPRSPRLRSSLLVELAELALISAGFEASRTAYRILFPDNYARLSTEELAGGFLVSVLTFWAALRLCEGAGPQESNGAVPAKRQPPV